MHATLHLHHPIRLLLCLGLSLAVGASVALGQEPDRGPTEPDKATPTLCGQPVSPSTRLPPATSGPVVYLLALCFSAQGNVSVIEPETYLYYVQLRPSRPSEGEWVPYNADTEQIMLADFQRLWATHFLDDLTIETRDYRFANGVVGKLVTYHLEERPRIRLVDYEGSRRIDRSRVEERLRERGIGLRLDSFLDESAVRHVKTIVREMLAEQGFPDAEVTHSITSLPGGPKLVHLRFDIDEGLRVMIRHVAFVGNRHVADGTLERVMKENRPYGLLSLITGRGRYRDAGFADDAQSIEDYYRDQGFVRARVGEPELRPLYDAADGTTRWVQLRIPVHEGERHRIGSLSFEGNQILEADVLRSLFKVKEGDWYNQKRLREGLEKARELYGAGGYMEFTGIPELRPSDRADGTTTGSAAGLGGTTADSHTAPDSDLPTVDVVVRVSEGPQYFVNRITFTGNTTTRDQVIRREINLVEGGVFNTEALKYSVRRINQLGYFKPLEGSDRDLQVEKAPGRDNAVDLTLRFEEQNRNQVTFGAGLSQYDGVFGNLAFTTTNFMGRGESLTLSGQKGARSGHYQLTFTQPYVFSRPISAGINLFSTKVDYLISSSEVGYSEVREGGGVTLGRRVFRFSQVFVRYGYEIIDTAASQEFLGSVTLGGFNPLLAQGHYTESRLSPALVHNTVDNPFMPRQGRKLDFGVAVAGGPIGGTTNYVRPELEVVQYIPHTRRTAFGLRGSAGWIRPYGSTRELPYYLRFFLGGEYQIRGVEIRTVGPLDAENRALGGDRFVLFNAEYYIDVVGPVRAVLFHDAGQAFGETQRVDLRQLRTSSGAELRFIVPMLNVPFRLIYAWNIYRDTFQPSRALKFAVGTTF